MCKCRVRCISISKLDIDKYTTVIYGDEPSEWTIKLEGKNKRAKNYSSWISLIAVQNYLGYNAVKISGSRNYYGRRCRMSTDRLRGGIRPEEGGFLHLRNEAEDMDVSK